MTLKLFFRILFFPFGPKSFSRFSSLYRAFTALQFSMFTRKLNNTTFVMLLIVLFYVGMLLISNFFLSRSVVFFFTRILFLLFFFLNSEIFEKKQWNLFFFFLSFSILLFSLSLSVCFARGGKWVAGLFVCTLAVASLLRCVKSNLFFQLLDFFGWLVSVLVQ